MISMKKLRTFVRIYLTPFLILTIIFAYTESKSSEPVQGKIIVESNRHNQRGLEYYKKGQYQEAIEEFNKALELYPKNVEAENNLGFVYWKIREYDLSEGALLDAVSLDPKRAIAYLNLGDLYVDMIKSEEAIKAYEKSLELSPTAKNAQQIKDKIIDLRALYYAKEPARSAVIFKIFYQASSLKESCLSAEPDDEACTPEGWRFKEVDLRGTGGKDFIATALIDCGSGGCRHYVYVQTTRGYKKVAIRWAGGEKNDDNSFFGQALVPSQRRINGYLVLVGSGREESVPFGLKGEERGWEYVMLKLVWTGNAYEVRRMGNNRVYSD